MNGVAEQPAGHPARAGASFRIAAEEIEAAATTLENGPLEISARILPLCAKGGGALAIANDALVGKGAVVQRAGSGGRQRNDGSSGAQNLLKLTPVGTFSGNGGEPDVHFGAARSLSSREISMSRTPSES